MTTYRFHPACERLLGRAEADAVLAAKSRSWGAYRDAVTSALCDETRTTDEKKAVRWQWRLALHYSTELNVWDKHALNREVWRTVREVINTRKGSVVYFVQGDSDSPIKIGITRGSMERRLKALQTGNPEVLSVLATAPGWSVTEAEIHEHFAGARVWGEWFSPTPELLALVDDLQAQAAARAA